jgi:glycosyltransferase involved in cell wall biosynthesis
MLVEISIVIITFNEEKNIGRCLDSIEGLSKDVVVVDSYSTDKTKQICIEKGVRFVEHKFDGHIEQKNYAVSQAKNQYVLSLDADESLTEELKETILSIRYNWEHDGYIFNRLTNYCGTWIKHSGWYPDKKLRLWDSTKGHWGGDNPHDKVIMDKDAKLKSINLDILHYSYYTIDDHLKQVEYFTNINSKAAFDKGNKSSEFKIVYKSSFKFFRDYIIKRGFLDGHAGFLIAKISAKATAMKYRKLLVLNKNK